MNYKIIRGASRIGGTITEISHGSTRIWVDFGKNLSAVTGSESDDEMIKLINVETPDALLFTHAHGDHTGLLYAIPDKLKEIYIGKTAKQMLLNVRDTLLDKVPDIPDDEKAVLQKERDILNSDRVNHYVDCEPFNVGEITVTPIMVDHSIYDAYMLKFEAGGKCILHTGDFRIHGRLGGDLIEKLKLAVSPQTVNDLIIEGTMMSRSNEERFSEAQLEYAATAMLQRKKYAFLICSSTNMESLASFYAATVISGNKSGRKPAFLVNGYVKKQLELYRKAIGEPKNNWRFCFHRSYYIGPDRELSDGTTQRQHMENDGFTMLISVNPYSIDYYSDIMEQFREYDPIVFYSMWEGYVQDKKPYSNPVLIELKSKWEKNWVPLHTSGHAYTDDIEKVIEAIQPTDRIIPVHTEKPDAFMELDISEELKKKIVLGDD